MHMQGGIDSVDEAIDNITYKQGLGAVFSNFLGLLYITSE